MEGNGDKVSFDFDGTLTRSDVQRYAKLLKKQGYEIHITTSRHKYMDLFDGEHTDLYEIAARIGIEDEHIHFLNCTDKAKFFMAEPMKFVFHLDDDWFVVDDINEHCNLISVCVLADAWVLRCDELLKYNAVDKTDKEAIRKHVNMLLNEFKGDDPAQLLMKIKEDIEIKFLNNKNKEENGI